jgi:hypothetical protein
MTGPTCQLLEKNHGNSQTRLVHWQQWRDFSTSRSSRRQTAEFCDRCRLETVTTNYQARAWLGIGENYAQQQTLTLKGNLYGTLQKLEW